MKIRSKSLLALVLAALILLTSVPAKADFGGWGWSYCKVSYIMDGGETKTEYVEYGQTIYLASAPNTSRKNFVGWSGKEKNNGKPEFLAGSPVTIYNDRNLYAVYFDRSVTDGWSVNDIPSVKKSKYKEIIFAGDSRILRAARAVGASTLKKKGIKTVAKGNIGLTEFQKLPKTDGSAKKGQKDLIAMVKADNDKKGKPIALVLCLGINDLKLLESKEEAESMAWEYISYLKSFRNMFSKYNVRFFFLSVNPVCGDENATFRSAYVIKVFNNFVRDHLPSKWTYLNSYSYLMKSGFCPFSKSDGVHYNSKTYYKVFTYAVKKINAS